MGILNSLLKNRATINFISSSNKSKLSKSDIIENNQIIAHSCNPNDELELEQLFNNLHYEPEIAIFDTFVAEEMFSSHILKRFPSCLRVLDTQDFHSLRIHRQVKLEEKEKFGLHVLQSLPHPQDNEFFARELASFYRSDLVLFCSDYEDLVVRKKFSIPNTGLAPFFYDSSQLTPLYNEGDKKDFVWIDNINEGNFNHPPNRDAIQWLINEMWPRIFEKLPNSELHIYGSNFPKEISQITHSNIKPKGLMKTLKTLEKYRVLLAPLRFGAGIKGPRKITDSWRFNVPVVTTPIGAEGLFLETTYGTDQRLGDHSSGITENSLNQIFEGSLQEYYEYTEDYNKFALNLKFGGLFSNFTTDDFVNSAIQLYQDSALWSSCQQIGFETMKKRMVSEVNEPILINKLKESKRNLTELRKNNYIQSLIWSETLRSHEKLAKYLIEKNKNRGLKVQ